MPSLLQQFLDKRKITKEELTPDETATFERWQSVLGTGDISVAKILDFCNNQLGIIEAQWRDLNNSIEKNNRLIVQHTVYKTLADLIQKPDTEREALEKYLQNLLTLT